MVLIKVFQSLQDVAGFGTRHSTLPVQISLTFEPHEGVPRGITPQC